MKRPRLLSVTLAPSATDDLGRPVELLAALAAPTVSIPPKYFYDALGSRLFAAITALPEYTPTRCEASIFARHLPAIAAALAPVATLVDLGAGNCEKAAGLLSALAVRRYVAVDLAADYLAESLENLQRRFPDQDLLGVVLDFSAMLRLPEEIGDAPRTLFYPGSSIGNFTPAAALRFLQQAHSACRGGALLIGVDLLKPVDVLEAAYDDPLGVTAAFNRNLLRHLNHCLGSDFALADWRHVAFFNSHESRIEMHLEALRETDVRWHGGGRRFAAGERLHTENSYKWRREDFAALLREAGFTRLRAWTDERDWFAVYAAFA